MRQVAARLLGGVFCLFLLCATEFAFAQSRPVQAYWESQQIRFRYQAFTTFYSCESLEMRLRDLLHAIGARKDARVEARCPDSLQRVQRSADVLLAFAIPAYAGAEAEAGKSADLFAADLREIVIGHRRPRNLESADCDLVHQFRRRVVDRLGLSVVDENIRCSPGRASFFAPTMKLRVLQPVATTQREPQKEPRGEE